MLHAAMDGVLAWMFQLDVNLRIVSNSCSVYAHAGFGEFELEKKVFKPDI
jgi:hypothetical protein